MERWQFHLKIDKDIKKWFRVYAAQNDTDSTKIVKGLLIDFYEKNK